MKKKTVITFHRQKFQCRKVIGSIMNLINIEFGNDKIMLK